jgi:hypothetical protein
MAESDASQKVDLTIGHSVPRDRKLLIAQHPLKDIIPSHPFRAMACGPSGSGKSNLIVEMLSQGMYYKTYFDRIYVFSPTVHTDDSWMDVRRFGNVLVFDVLDPKTLQELVDLHSYLVKDCGVDQAPRVLFIFDDCLSEKTLKSGPMKTLFFRGRHLNASFLIGSQSFMAVERALRLQLTNLFVFSPSPSEITRISDEFANVVAYPERVTQMLRHATSERYRFMHINKQVDPSLWYRCGLGHVYKNKI